MTAPQQLAPALPVRPSDVGSDPQEFCGIRVHYGRGGGLVDPPRRRSEGIFALPDLGIIGGIIGVSMGSHWGAFRAAGGDFNG